LLRQWPAQGRVSTINRFGASDCYHRPQHPSLPVSKQQLLPPLINTSLLLHRAIYSPRFLPPFSPSPSPPTPWTSHPSPNPLLPPPPPNPQHLPPHNLRSPQTDPPLLLTPTALPIPVTSILPSLATKQTAQEPCRAWFPARLGRVDRVREGGSVVLADYFAVVAAAADAAVEVGGFVLEVGGGVVVGGLGG